MQLLFDILIHSVLLYYAGGPTNPFASYFLVPLTIAAATLSWLYTAALASIAMLAYSLLLFWYHPLPLFEMRTGENQSNIRVIGMWLNFAMSAGLITLFVVHMAEALRKHAERLATVANRACAIRSCWASPVSQRGRPMNCPHRCRP